MGRAGTFIAIDIAIDAITEELYTLKDILPDGFLTWLVWNLREQRPQMIQTDVTDRVLIDDY